MADAVSLGLGSNLGDRAAALGRARVLLQGRGFETLSRSSTWLTEPVGGPPQGWFLNEVLGGKTALSPEELLAACLATEKELGRVRGERFGPRTIDIDILFYDALRRDSPGLGLTAAEMRARCPDRSEVRLLSLQEGRP